jgi:predicted enzyme related to lactoylglutathione lyase
MRYVTCVRERATQKGGNFSTPPCRHHHGARIAQLSDPQGAKFALHENMI